MAIDSEWFYRMLEDRGTSARALADFLGLDPSSVSRMLKGERKMSAEEPDGIARYLEVPLELVATHRRGGVAGFGEQGQEAFEVDGDVANRPALGGPDKGVSATAVEGAAARRIRHPIFGCMKGTVTIPDDLDLTAPADPDWGRVYEDD